MTAYRWIVTDLDGTLVDRSLRMVPRSKRALRHFRAGGGRVVIATGRSRESAAPYYAELGLTGPAILLNGALICDLSTGEVLLDHRFTESAWIAVCGLLDELSPNTAGVAFVGGNAYRIAESPLIDAYAARDRLTIEVLNGWDQLPADRVSKAMVLCGNSNLTADVAGRAADLDVSIVVSEPTYAELLPSGVDKGAALTWLASHCGVSLEEIAAIGDNPNDIPMFQVAGLGAAVSDGHPDARSAAAIIVGQCADGAVADLVAHICSEGIACPATTVGYPA